MEHYQYRIVETQYADGHTDYTVEDRSDWFGTGIFWLCSWYVCTRVTADSGYHRFFAVFNTKQEAIDFLNKRKQIDNESLLRHTVKKKTIFNP